VEASAESRAAQYDRVYAVIARDPLALDLHRQALGAEYPEGIDVTGGCTRGTLERAPAGLRLRPGSLLIDLGCGRGGPGRWLARASGARVLGIDISQVAVGAAADAAEAFLRAGQYGYLRGTFDATGLPDGCADGVVAIEALGMAPDRGKAVAEVRRILRPGGRASITGAERHGPGKAAPGEAAPGKTAPGDGASSQTPSSQTSSGDASSGDVFRWAPLVGAAGLDVVSRYVDETRSARWLAVCALWLEHEAELRGRLGDAAEDLIQDARDAPAAWGIPGLVGVQLIVERAPAS
jgi:SAM-dependent methyltransferase